MAGGTRSPDSLPGKRPKIIVLTAELATDNSRHLVKKIGIDYYLAKPVDPKVLIKLISD